MASKRRKRTTGPQRGLLARPLDALVFLLPLIAFYEIASLAYPARVLAFDLTQRFFELFGQVGMLAPGLAVVTILIATHVASGEPWEVHWRRVGLMYVEAALLAVPLVGITYLIPLTAPGSVEASLTAPGSVAAPLAAQFAEGVGAGVYEELVFRLVLISLLMLLGADMLHLDRGKVAVAAVVLSSLAFAALHHQPFGDEPLRAAPFAFRTLAGAYLAAIFWFRGYGPAAGCHAAYNVVVIALNQIEA